MRRLHDALASNALIEDHGHWLVETRLIAATAINLPLPYMLTDGLCDQALEYCTALHCTVSAKRISRITSFIAVTFAAKTVRVLK